MRILCIGDPHIMEKEIPQAQVLVEELIAFAEEENPRLIVICGDVLHTFRTVKLDPLFIAKHLFESLGQIARTVVLVGNHDRRNNKEFLTPYHPFVGMENIENVDIVWKTEKLQFDQYVFVFVPYVYPGRFQEAIDTLEYKGHVTCYFGHQEFKGVKMGSVVSEEGDVWSLEKPLVVTGHIHHFHMLQKNIMYLGTPSQHNFGESTDKGVVMLDIKPDGTFVYKRSRLNTCVKETFCTFYDDVKNGTFEVPEPTDRRMVRVEISGTKEQIKGLIRSKMLKPKRGLRFKYNVQEDLDAKIKERVNKNMNFIDRMYEKIKTRDDLVEIHENVCAGF